MYFYLINLHYYVKNITLGGGRGRWIPILIRSGQTPEQVLLLFIMVKKVKTARKRKLTLKQQGFVKDYIQTKNGSKAIKQNYEVVDDNTAGVMAHENLSKPKIIKAIDSALQGVGLNDKHVAKIHKRNMDQDTHLHVSQTAVKDYYGVTGRLDKASSNAGPVNVAFIIQTDKG